MAVLVMAVSTGSATKSELVQTKLSQHLMSAASYHDSHSHDSSDDMTQSLSSGSGQASTGWYGHWSNSDSSSAAPDWQKQLNKMEVCVRVCVCVFPQQL